jgi:ribonuclease P protein subunit RPR2
MIGGRPPSELRTLKVSLSSVVCLKSPLPDTVSGSIMVNAGKSSKSSKSGNGGGIPQKHLHSRISFLYQAAVYLDSAQRRVCTHEAEDIASRQPSLGELGELGELSNSNELPVHQIDRVDAGQSSTKLSIARPRSPSGPRIARPSSPQSHHLLSSMRSVSQKSQIRLSKSIKRSVCRRCNGLLSTTGTAEIENLSRGGRKPWAEVLVVRCCLCGFVKRYPVGGGDGGRAKTKQKSDRAAAGLKESVEDTKHPAET